MSIHNINRRLDQLDARHPAETPRRVIRLIVGEDEETSGRGYRPMVRRAS